MGQLALTVAGGIGGFLIGGPLGASIGMTLGGALGASLFGPTVEGPRLNDLKVTASTYGKAIPEIYGTVRIGGNVIWSTGLRETKHTERAGGGKGGGPKQTTYKYDATFAVAICKGEIEKILRVWADGKLIYDNARGSKGGFFDTGPGAAPVIAQAMIAIFSGSQKKKKNVSFRTYRGTEDQLPDSLIEADKGVGNVSAHRGLAYCVFERLPLEDFGNRIPQLTFEVSKASGDSFPNIIADPLGSEVQQGAFLRWVPDWDLGRLLNITNQGIDVYNLDTMQRMYGAAPPFGAAQKFIYLQGEQVIIYTEGLGNSAQNWLYNTQTLTPMGYFGEPSRMDVGGFVDANNREYGTGNLGPYGYGRYTLNGRVGRHVIATAWTRDSWVVDYPDSGLPVFRHKTPFQPAAYVEGSITGPQSEIIGWRSGNERFEGIIYRTAGGAASSIYGPINDKGDMAWAPSTAWSAEVINLQPFDEYFDPRIVLYDKTDGCLFMIGGGVNNEYVTAKYYVAEGTWKFRRKYPRTGGLFPPGYADSKYSRIEGGTFGYGYQSLNTNPHMIEIDLQSGEVLRNAEVTELGTRFATWSNQNWDDRTSSLVWKTATHFRRIFFAGNYENLTVASIAYDVCKKTGVLTDADIDTSGLKNQRVIGYMIDRETTARDVLKQLASGYLFDGYESDYKLKFRSRGGNSQVTIPEDWIIRQSDEPVVSERLTQELELPLRISVNYYDLSRDHQQGNQSAKRKSAPYPTMWTKKEDTVELPLVWNPDDAKQCADKLLKMAWANRTAFSFQLPWRYLKYDPTDLATINLESGTTYSTRLVTANIGADFTLDAQAVSEKATAYDSTAKGATSGYKDQFISVTYEALPLVMNLPLIRDTDYDATGMASCYVGATTNSFTFTGAALYASAGIDFDSFGSVSNDPVTGFALNALPPTTAYESTDEDSIIKVRLADGSQTLESVTQDQMLTDYKNAALLGDEIIQFRDAQIQADGEWWLTGILRARRGTNYAVRSHTAGERFIMLDPATLTKYTRAPEDYEVYRQFKAVSSGDSVDEATAVPANLIPRDVMPLTPEDFHVSDDGTTVTMSASRRSRVTSPLAGGTGAIHYREGDKASASFTYKVWADKDFEDIEPIAAPEVNTKVALFDATGDDTGGVLTFPLATLGGASTCLVRLTENGFAEGTPKWLFLERLGQDRWNVTEFY